MTKRIKRDYGSYNVEKRKNSWRCRVWLPVDPATGKRSQKSFSAKSKAEVIALADEFFRLQKQGIDINAGNALLKNWLPDWVDAYCTSQGLKPASRSSYNIMARNAIDCLGDVPLSKILPSHLDELVRSRGEEMTASTVRMYRLLKMALEDAEINGLIERTPFARHRAPKAPRAEEARFLDDGEVTKLLAAAEGTRLQRPLAFMLATGIRSSELFALKKTDLNLDGENASVTIRRNVRTSEGQVVWGDAKTVNGLRSIDISPVTTDLLKAHMGTLLLEQMKSYRWDDDSLLFPSSTGSVWTYKSFKKTFDRVTKAAGLVDVSPHATRHTHAAHSIADGEQAFHLSRRLGHGSVAFTLDYYGHLFSGGQEISSRVMDKFIAAV